MQQKMQIDRWCHFASSSKVMPISELATVYQQLVWRLGPTADGHNINYADATPATAMGRLAANLAPSPQFAAKVGRMYEYKVLTQKDKFFGGKFSPDKLEMSINAYAEQGWRVVSMATASLPSTLGSGRDELIVLFERGPRTT